MQISLNITNTINYNNARQIIPCNHAQPTGINMNMNKHQNNKRRPEQDNDERASDTDQTDDEQTSDQEPVTSSTSDDSEDENQH
jgi:hypothetical protein